MILLSNIADYLSYTSTVFGTEEFLEYIESFNKLLNDEGVIINYLYNFGEEVKNDNIVRLETNPFNLQHEGYYRVRKSTF